MEATLNPKVTGKFYKGFRNVTPMFLQGGHAVFKVKGAIDTFTYLVRKTGSGFAVYVRPQTGADQYIGVVRFGTSSASFKWGTTSGFLKSHKAVVMFEWAFGIIMRDGCTPTGYRIVHSDECSVCRRPLTHPKSIKQGMGAMCLERLNKLCLSK